MDQGLELGLRAWFVEVTWGLGCRLTPEVSERAAVYGGDPVTFPAQW